jgi:SAM-dependent methyltransferase
VEIRNFMERVLGARAGRVPAVPSLNLSELKTLRQVFDSHAYASEPSPSENGKPDILKMLFAHGLPVRLEQARDTFHPLDLDRVIESGLLYEEHNEVKACFQAQPYRGLILFSDFFQWESDPDFVLPIGPAGNYLALLTIRRHVESTLDLGCGCGIQSLLAAHHSDKVIATDINPRALTLTRFNAELNDIHNIETRLGSYFEPVNGQRFDLIVANLPYVIGPERRLIYRTVDRVGDAGLHERLKEIPACLSEGGFAQLLINWVHKEPQDPSEPIQQAIEGREMDAWLIHNGSKEPGEYAEMWLKHQIQSDPGKFQKAKREWLHWYRRHHIDRIALGALTLRRRSRARNWFCSATVNRTLEDPAGEQILRLFAAQDYLSTLETTDTIFSESFTLIDLGFTEDKNEVTAYSTRASRSEAKILPTTKAVLQNLDGTTTLEKAVQIVSHESGMEAAKIQHEILASIKELLKLGMIQPQTAEQPSVPPLVITERLHPGENESTLPALDRDTASRHEF